MRSRALLIALTISLISPFTPAMASEPKVAIAYDIGFLGDNSFNDAVHVAFKAAKKKYGLVEPFVREVPTNGTAVDRLTRLRFLAKSGYTLVIAVGPGYRETVRRVSMEYTETQFALINDKELGQLNISNVFFREDQGAYLAGVLAALESKKKSVAFIGSEPELLDSFRSGVRVVSKKVSVINISYPDEISEVSSRLEAVDIAYSTWDGDASILSLILEKYRGKVRVIVETPDQYFAALPNLAPIILASINKSLTKPIDQLVKAALADDAIIDVLDEKAGIYGREFNVKNGGITVNFNKKMDTSTLNRLKIEIAKLSKSA
jgi:basic membrane protein A